MIIERQVSSSETGRLTDPEHLPLRVKLSYEARGSAGAATAIPVAWHNDETAAG